MFVIMNMVTYEVDSTWDTVEQAAHRLDAIQHTKIGFALYALIQS